jgi:ABC-2 type transport system ATP-binding protein
MQDAAIQTRDLRKTFGSKVAVKGLTLEVNRGEVFGFLGPNGAGKSTSVKMLLGLIEPTGGAASVLGRPMGDVATRRRVGFLPEHFRFHDWLTAAEFLDLHGRLYGMPRDLLRRRSGDLMELVGLADHRTKRLRDFSKGMLQRIGLAQALLNDPELVFLDEPTSGLDPVGRRMVRDIIRDQRSRGATVFLNSHLLSEVEITCDRVAFIKHGEVLDIRQMDRLAPGVLSVSVRAQNVCAEALEGQKRWATVVRAEGERLSLEVESENVLPDILEYLVAGGARVYSFNSEQVSLEDLFIQIVGTDGGL